MIMLSTISYVKKNPLLAYKSIKQLWINNVLEVCNTEIGQPVFEYLYFGSIFGVTIQGLCNLHAKIYLSHFVI